MSRYAEIEKALRNLELGANTIDRCYSHRPENFAAALRDLREYAELARAALALPEDSKVVNAELYGMAIALADSAARSDVECLCDFNEEAVGTWYFLNGSGQEYAEDTSRAARYLSLREASGEPMPYKVVRDGDKVRFE